MLGDIKGAGETVRKGKGGQSIFEAEQLKNTLMNHTDAPGLSDSFLHENLSRVITSPRLSKKGDLK